MNASAINPNPIFYQHMFRFANDIILLADTGGRILECNERAVEAYGLPHDQIVGRSLTDLRTPEARTHFQKDLDHLLTAGALIYETEHQTADGRRFPVEASVRLIEEDGNAYILQILRDISERKAHEARIHELAYFDPVTRLPNRDLFHDRLTQALAMARRDGLPLMVILIGLPDFRRLSAPLGEAGSQTLLVETSARLLRCIRAEDTLARLGADEFAFVLHTDTRGAERVAAQVLARFAEPFRVAGQQLAFECDLGIASHPEDGRSAEELLRAARVALASAFTEKGSIYRFHMPQLGLAAQRRIEIETGLRDALARGELCLHYQPQIEIASGRVTGVEALMRWRHAGQGWVPPGEFIPVAEDCGLINALGSWALDTALAQVAGWRAQGLELRMAVNLSAAQLRAPNLPDDIRRRLARHAVPPEAIEIEITESMAMRDIDQARTRLRALTDTGVRLAIDDFGTGYSSLASMKHIHVDLLKIDASFVAGLPEDAKNAAIAAAIIAMAGALGARTLAEGVETAGQFAWLRAHGCHLAQGWHFARAMPAEEIAAYCRERCSTPQ
jgi:PAS domain S-box-containing protein/diguanylate cyclase (GGDEF)-like protein